MSDALLEADIREHAYGGRVILADVKVQLRPSSTLAVLGASGSGKSTLLRLLDMLEEPTRGRVDVAGRRVISLAERRLARRKIGLVQQRPGLLTATVLDNAAFIARAHGLDRNGARREATSALARVGLAHLSDAQAATLSGGEVQRLALARALAARPEVLLLDEATNQLDPGLVRQVEEVLREEAARGCALVLVTHSPNQAKRVCQRVIFLEGGRVNAEGPSSILDEPPTEGLRTFLAFA